MTNMGTDTGIHGTRSYASKIHRLTTGSSAYATISINEPLEPFNAALRA